MNIGWAKISINYKNIRIKKIEIDVSGGEEFV